MTPLKTKLTGLNWYGWMYAFSGYGKASLEYSTAIEALTGFVSVPWERRQEGDSEWHLYSPAQQALFKKPLRQEEVGIVKATPPVFERNTCKFRIGYTMVENTRVGKDWVDMINKMDALLVPSKYLVGVFQESGVTVPIRAVKQGIDTVRFQYVRPTVKDRFIFATIGYIDDRKNWQDLVTAFTSEFAPNEPVELWIKNSSPDWGFNNFADKRIKLIHKMYTEPELYEFYGRINCFVFPTHAEGAGMPPREAMARGIPTITTNWSGTADLCKPECSWGLDPVAIDFPDNRGCEQPGYQARLDVQQLMYFMREIYENPNKAFDKAKVGSDWVHQNFNWENCAKDLLAQVDTLL